MQRSQRTIPFKLCANKLIIHYFYYSNLEFLSQCLCHLFLMRYFIWLLRAVHEGLALITMYKI